MLAETVPARAAHCAVARRGSRRFPPLGVLAHAKGEAGLSFLLLFADS